MVCAVVFDDPSIVKNNRLSKQLEKQSNNLAQLYFYNYHYGMFTHCDLSVGDVASDHIQVRLHIFLNMVINVNLIEKTYQEITE